MKLLKIIIINLGVVAASYFYISCAKTAPVQLAAVDANFSNKAIVQAYLATVNASRNYIYVDANPVTGTLLSSGSVYPPSNIGTGFNVDGGVRAFLVRDTLPTTTQVPFSFAQNMSTGKHYTLFLYDTISSPKQKTVADNIVIPADTTAMLRFANMPYSPVAVPAVDIFSVKRNAVIFSNVSPTDVTGYIPYASALTDTFFVRLAGSSSNLQNFRPVNGSTPAAFLDILVALTPTQKRSYTLIFRGGYTATTTTNATVRTLSTFTNN